MANRSEGKGKKEEDPELALKRKFRAKCRFKSIVRLALANSYWLIDDEAEHYEGVDNVKRRVAQAVRSKVKKKKKLLTLMDKALLNKPAEDRTDQEKRYIYSIIGGLKCFKQYPNHVKRRLAAVTYFRYYGPNRVIVRHHQEANAMYFIISGAVAVSQMVYDGLLNMDVPVEIGTMNTGDLFGEVSLLHNIPRSATCTTIGHCELLMLIKEDFKNVLQVSIQHSWDEVRCAMSVFSYFDGMDEVARREGCIVAKMKSFGENETILGDGVGVPNFVYFVLTGRCQMIESLQVSSTTRLGRTTYTLYDPYVSSETSEEDLAEKYFGALKDEQSNESEIDLKSEPEQSNLSTFKILESILKIGQKSSKRIRDNEFSANTSELKMKNEGRNSIRRSLGSRADLRVKSPKRVSHEPLHGSSLVLKDDKNDETHIFPHPETMRESVRFSITPKLRPPNLRTYFMQVCQFFPGSTFGFGENMRDRRIVALTRVDCMLMPKIWLLQRNTANIWTRIQHYLTRKIPSKKDLFKSFVTERNWADYRTQLVEEVLARAQTVNWTSVHDVPYSIRMEEMIDI
ncbi:uncharacterized protein LOC142974199 [Anticarsia gemmatalis]|uniref:uncharacterized protein LOC142974199 n=1 Tax=Anticarsia gemmatalis TaxID=129554 RepID=UPI003F77045E